MKQLTSQVNTPGNLNSRISLMLPDTSSAFPPIIITNWLIALRVSKTRKSTRS